MVLEAQNTVCLTWFGLNTNIMLHFQLLKTILLDQH